MAEAAYLQAPGPSWDYDEAFPSPLIDGEESCRKPVKWCLEEVEGSCRLEPFCDALDAE